LDGLKTVRARSRREASKALVGFSAVVGAAPSQAARLQAVPDSNAAVFTAIADGAGGVLAGVQQVTEPAFGLLKGFISDPTVREIGLSLANTVIAWAVPVGAVLVVLGAMSGPKGQQEKNGEMSPFNLFQKPPGFVKEYLTIERLNDQLESYSFSVTKALRNERQAKLEKQRAAFARTYGAEIASQLNDTQIKKLTDADKKFQTKVCQLRVKSDGITRELRSLAAQSVDGKAGGMPMPMPMPMPMKKMSGPETSLQNKQVEIAKQYSSAEVEYIKAVSKELPKDTREQFTKLLKTSKIGLQQDQGESPFLSVEEAPSHKPHVWCLKFNGDVQAKQVESLRQEVTAVIRTANVTRLDEVVLRLSSPGGTVTGYGSAASQLLRLKRAGLKLTICVEEVAASGGYMMACVADHLVASPMAVLGSIGVISELPNAYERLEREGLRFLTVTAGPYKRTLTPFKKPTKEDQAKLTEDLGMVWSEFKSFVQEQRPVLDVEKYGTGETWFGKEALRRQLCDEIANSDDVILDKLDKGAEIYGVKYSDPSKKSFAGIPLPARGELSDSSTIRTLLGRLLLGESLADIVEPPAAKSRFMALDQTGRNTYLIDE
jgi:signal peptide peptidase SppA